MTDDSPDDTSDRSDDDPERSDDTPALPSDDPEQPSDAPDRPADATDQPEDMPENEQNNEGGGEELFDRPDRTPHTPVASGVTEWIRSVVRSVEQFGRRHGANDTAFDVDISIGSGLDSIGRGRTWEEDRTDPARTRESLGKRPRGQRSDPRASRQLTSGDEYNVTTHTDETEMLVTADVAGVAEDDVFVGFEADELVVGVEGNEIERIDVPWSERRAEASVRNGILTVRIEHDTHD